MLQKDLELRKEIIVTLKKTMLTEDILIRLVAFYNTGVDYLLYLTDVKMLVDIVPQKLPLGEEQELQIGEELHIVGQQRSVLLQNGLAFAQADVLVLPDRKSVV